MKFLTPLLILFLNISILFSQTLSKVNNFKDGEVLKYQIKYGFIHGGVASASLKLTNYKGKIVFHAIITGNTTGIADKIFKVKDTYESYFDTSTLLPLKAIRNIKEGNYRYYNEVYYDHANSAIYNKRLDSIIKVPARIMDMTSALYYLRNVEMHKLKKGDAVEVITYFGDEVFPFKIRYTGLEYVTIKKKKIKCHRFDPVVEPGRIFKSEDDMTVWISADKNQIPIVIRFDMWVGAIYCELESFESLKYEFIFETLN